MKAGHNRPMRKTPLSICVLGGTGTIGQAVVAELERRDARIHCLVRMPVDLPSAHVQIVDLQNQADVDRAFEATHFDVVISCIASRTGVSSDAWAVDHRANMNILQAARSSGVAHFILLSAICVQKPRLAFQHAKLAFEEALIASGIRYSIVRPTAFFKSLSGQIERVRAGKAFLLFGDGQATACKPISDRDLATYVVDCIDDEMRWNRILPIGGPGPAMTSRAQGEALFFLTGQKRKFRSVSPNLLAVVAHMLGAVGRLMPALRAKAEYARIGHYYATESMLVWDSTRGCYDADATPETGRDTLVDHYRMMLSGEPAPDSAN